jgi:non-heme chloroperoxidase
MPSLETRDGTRLSYVDWGRGPAVIFLHGRGLSHDFYSYQLSRLANDFRVIAYDLRGHGDSDKPNSSYDHNEHAQDLMDLISVLGLENVNLVGASTGSFIIQNYVKLYGLNNISSCSLVSATPVFMIRQDFPFAFSKEGFDKIRKDLESDYPKAISDFLHFLCYAQPSKETFSWMFNLSIRTPLHVLLKTLKANIAMDYRDILRKFDKPVMICHGMYDRLCPLAAAEFLNRNINNSRLVVFKLSGHLPYIEEHEKFDEELCSFLLSVRK